VAGLGLLALVGAVAGSLLLGNLSGGALDVVLAFGVAALLYLVTEELLVEAHEREDTPWVTALFFIGFLVLFVLE
jgi:ZIP family zinc transporter